MKDIKTSRCSIGKIENNKQSVFKVNQIRASSFLEKKYVQSKLEKILNSDILFIEGYFILGKYDIVDFLLTEYDNIGRKIAFNVSASFICEKKKEELKRIFNCSNYIFATEEEITKFLGTDINDPLLLSKAFHEALDVTTKHRHLILMNGKTYQLVTSYDYSNSTFIQEHEHNDTENSKYLDMSGTRDGNKYKRIFFNIYFYQLIL